MKEKKPSLEGLKKAQKSLEAFYNKEPSEELLQTLSECWGEDPNNKHKEDKMHFYISKLDFEAISHKGLHVVAQGQVFAVSDPTNLPHPVGQHPELDESPFTETDHWAINGKWKDQYDKFEISGQLKKVK